MNSFLKAGLIVGLAVSLNACAPMAEQSATDADEAGAGAVDEARADSSVPAAPVAATPRPAAPASTRAAAPAESAPAQSLAPTAPARRVFEIPEGTSLTFNLIDSVSTETSQPGDTFEASLSEAFMMDGATVIPKNAIARGRVLAVDEPGRVQGRARIELAMTEILVGGQAVPIETRPFVAEAESTRTEDAKKIGIGAGIGAAIGGILGGGKGAATGAAVGGGTGTGVVLATRGDQIVYPSETKLDFTLSESVSITESAGN